MWPLHASLGYAHMQQLHHQNHLTLMLYARVSYKIAYGMENQLEDARTPLQPAQPTWEVLPNVAFFPLIGALKHLSFVYRHLVIQRFWIVQNL